MADIESFVKAPSHAFLEKCTNEQLLRIAAYYEINVADKKLKENIKVDLKSKLFERGVLEMDKESV